MAVCSQGECDTATERQVNVDYNIAKSNSDGVTETHMTTGRGTYMELSKQDGYVHSRLQS